MKEYIEITVERDGKRFPVRVKNKAAARKRAKWGVGQARMVKATKFERYLP